MDFKNLIEKDNYYCFDCLLPYPIYSSINNGILLCYFCSENHKLNISNKAISKIVKLDSNIDSKVLIYILNGGNNRLKSIFIKYNLIKDNISNMSTPDECSKLIKKYNLAIYNTRVAYMYRLILENEVCGNYYSNLKLPRIDYGKEQMPLINN